MANNKRTEPDTTQDIQQIKKQCTLHMPVDMRKLFGSGNYEDVAIKVEDTVIKCHRCVLHIIPFFESAFRTGAAMTEGQGSVFTVNFAGAYSSILAMIKFVYGFPSKECLLMEADELLRTYEECEMYEYAPFLDNIWAYVQNLRIDDKQKMLSITGTVAENVSKTFLVSPEQGKAIFEFGAKRDLPIEVSCRDFYPNNKVISLIGFDILLWLIKNVHKWDGVIVSHEPLFPFTPHTKEGTCFALAYNWLIHHPPIEIPVWEVLRSLCGDIRKVDVLIRNTLYKHNTTAPPHENALASKLVMDILWNTMPSISATASTTTPIPPPAPPGFGQVPQSTLFTFGLPPGQAAAAFGANLFPPTNADNTPTRRSKTAKK